MSVRVSHRVWSRLWLWVSVLHLVQHMATPPTAAQFIHTKLIEEEMKSTTQIAKCSPSNSSDVRQTKTTVGVSQSNIPVPSSSDHSSVALDFIEPNTVFTSPTEENGGFLSCSTTVRILPAKVHGCPDGFRCQIYESGDPVTGKPNRGMCMNDVNPSADESDEDGADDVISSGEYLREISTVYLPGGCLLKTNEYTDLESFLKGGHYLSCKCKEGAVQCKVPQKAFVEATS